MIKIGTSRLSISFLFCISLTYTMEHSPEIQGLHSKRNRLSEQLQQQKYTSAMLYHEENYKKDLAAETVHRRRILGALLTCIGVIPGMATIGAYLEMREKHATFVPIVCLGTVTLLCMGYGLDRLFSSVHTDGNKYYAIRHFPRIRKKVS